MIAQSFQWGARCFLQPLPLLLLVIDGPGFYLFSLCSVLPNGYLPYGAYSRWRTDWQEISI